MKADDEAASEARRYDQSKARELSKITQGRHPELRDGALELMKIARKSREKLESLDAATRKNGHLDRNQLKRELDSVIDAMREVNRKLDDLLAKARR